MTTAGNRMLEALSRGARIAMGWEIPDPSTTCPEEVEHLFKYHAAELVHGQNLHPSDVLTVMQVWHQAQYGKPHSRMKKLVDSALGHPEYFLGDEDVLGLVPGTQEGLGKAEPLNWLWEGYVAEGLFTLLAAAAKIGKSTAISLVLDAGREGGSVGMPVSKLKAVVMPEEPRCYWQERQAAGMLGDHVWFVPFENRPVFTSLSEWADYLSKLTVRMKDLGVNLLIIDTLTQFAPITDENDAVAVRGAVVPLKNIVCASGIAVLATHHIPKKSQGGVRGSGEFVAVPDIIFGMERARGRGSRNQRVLTLEGSRRMETPVKLTMELTVSSKSKDSSYSPGLGHSRPISCYKTVSIERQNVGLDLKVAPTASKRGLCLNVIKGILKKENATLGQVVSSWPKPSSGGPKRPSEKTLRRYLHLMAKNGDLRAVTSKTRGGPTLFGLNV